MHWSGEPRPGDLEAHIEGLHEAERAGHWVHLGAAVLEAWYQLIAGQPAAAAAALERVTDCPSLASEVWRSWAKAEMFRQLGKMLG